jgi:hypothetical protein
MIALDITEEISTPATGASAFPWGPPSSSSIDSTATQSLVAALPEDTFQLIVREAYLFRAGQLILDAMTEAKARFDAVSASRPPFFVLRRPETKEAFQAAFETSSQDLSLYTRALQRNADAMKRLRKCAELHIEDWLRENDTTYYSGLVSESLVADWRRCLARLDTEIDDFTRALGCARNSLVAPRLDADGNRYVSDVSRESIERAADVGALLATDVAATNALADERDRFLHGTAFASEFPRLPAFDFAHSLREATGLPVPFLQQEFGKIMERCSELRAVGLPSLLAQVAQAEAQHTAVKEGYLVGVWQALREFCLAHYVDEKDLNEVAQATEQMFERGAFA